MANSRVLGRSRAANVTTGTIISMERINLMNETL